MKIVYKYNLNAYPLKINMHFDSRVIKVAAQNILDLSPTLWVEHPRNPDLFGLGQTLEHEYVRIGTGLEVPENTSYVGSAICDEGNLVWHVYRMYQK